MNASKHRTSFALDDGTIERLRRLAARWQVSQAEVIRRAVRIAADQEQSTAISVEERLQEYRSGGRLSRTSADEYLKQVERDRESWGRD